MNPDIIIPTFRKPEEIAPLVCEVEGFSYGCRVIATCKEASAAVNRNAGLAQATTPIVIMIDDDTAGFYEGWWREMIRPLEEDPAIVMVSARLLKADGSIGQMMYLGNVAEPAITSVPRCATACIAFRNDGLRFDEHFEGSGFEDDDYCAQQFKKYKNAKTVINNRVRIIHLNEMKNQSGTWWEKNKEYFDKKWITTGGGAIRVPKPDIAYHSENGEDEWLNDHIFMGQRKGVFFECGALDGIHHSNTMFFEEALGWTGLCAEANPDEYKKLKNNRTCRTENTALWYEDGENVEFIRIEGDLRGWSGIRDSIEPQRMKQIRESVVTENNRMATIIVPAMCLVSMLLRHSLKKIDLFSLDIEGAEYLALKYFPFKNFDIRVFVIEDNFHNYPLQDLMNRNGYTKIHTCGPNDIYIREDEAINNEAIVPQPAAYTPKINKALRLKELQNVQRVPLPPDIVDDNHNRIAGLIEMIKELFPKSARVVEIGTGQGVSTEVFALLCGEVTTTDSMSEEDPWRVQARAVFARYENIKHFNMASARLASILPDKFFDVVYIDAGHTYEAVRDDIRNWRAKVKPGGLICGHDYIDRPKHGFGVIKAVDEAFGKPEKTYKDTSWAVRVPK